MEDISLSKKNNPVRSVLGKLIPAAIILALLTVFFLGISRISSDNIAHQEESLRMAIDRDIVQCYSLEGMYPPSLEYLEVHYGLVYDKDLFFVDYRPIASNIYPDVTILRVHK